MEAAPKVSVCVATFNNPGMLRQTLESLERQVYLGEIEVVVVDDGSTLPSAHEYYWELEPSFRERGWRLEVQANQGPGVARNHAASLASGEFLMFMDDDNVAKSFEVSTFVEVAQRTGADALTCASDYFRGDAAPSDTEVPWRRWVPIGAAKYVGMFQNMYGDTNAMVRASAFRAVGGFPEDAGYAMEDWELFSKIIVGGFRLETVPKPLYWYRIREASHSKITAKYANNLRTIRPYLQELPQALHPLALFAQGVPSRLEDTRAELQTEVEGGHKLAYSLSAVANSLTSLCANTQGTQSTPRRQLRGERRLRAGGGGRGGPSRRLAPARQRVRRGSRLRARRVGWPGRPEAVEQAARRAVGGSPGGRGEPDAPRAPGALGLGSVGACERPPERGRRAPR